MKARDLIGMNAMISEFDDAVAVDNNKKNNPNNRWKCSLCLFRQHDCTIVACEASNRPDGKHVFFVWKDSK